MAQEAFAATDANVDYNDLVGNQYQSPRGKFISVLAYNADEGTFTISRGKGVRYSGGQKPMYMPKWNLAKEGDDKGNPIQEDISVSRLLREVKYREEKGWAVVNQAKLALKSTVDVMDRIGDDGFSEYAKDRRDQYKSGQHDKKCLDAQP